MRRQTRIALIAGLLAVLAVAVVTGSPLASALTTLVIPALDFVLGVIEFVPRGPQAPDPRRPQC